jgi:hypothetical protein
MDHPDRLRRLLDKLGYSPPKDDGELLRCVDDAIEDLIGRFRNPADTPEHAAASVFSPQLQLHAALTSLEVMLDAAKRVSDRWGARPRIDGDPKRLTSEHLAEVSRIGRRALAWLEYEARMALPCDPDADREPGHPRKPTSKLEVDIGLLLVARGMSPEDAAKEVVRLLVLHGIWGPGEGGEWERVQRRLAHARKSDA